MKSVSWICVFVCVDAMGKHRESKRLTLIIPQIHRTHKVWDLKYQMEKMKHTESFIIDKWLEFLL